MNDLVFIYLGANLPRYVPASLRLAERHSGLDVTFIGNRDFRPHIPRVGVDFVDVESFYAPSAFAQAGAKVSLSADFRGGFWLKTLERLFVLEQFMAATARKSLLHAELDQLTFRVDLLLENLLLSPRKGIFFPFHSERKAVASVLFCNDIGSISDLLMNASSGPAFENEMELLVRWALASPDRVAPLTTLGDLHLTAERGSASERIPENLLGGVVDAAELGLWVGGRDPRNLPLWGAPRTKFTYPVGKARLSLEQLSGLKFSFDAGTSQLFVQPSNDSEPQRLFNLHIHSKVHSWLWSHDRDFDKLFGYANQPKSVGLPGTRRTQVLYRGAKRMRRTARRVGGPWRGLLRRVRLATAMVATLARRTRKKLADRALENGFLLAAQIVSPNVTAKKIRAAIRTYEINSKTLDLLEGSRIALVGPGPVGTDTEQLENYDWVARIGYTGLGSGPEIGPSRCDLTFLAKWHAAAMARATFDFGKEMATSMVFLRHDVEKNDADAITNLLQAERFSTEPCDKIFAKVIPNFGPQVIMWLLACKPSELHITNVDLMTDPRRPRNYATNKPVQISGAHWELPKETLRRSFSQFHNPFTHFMFFKSLSKVRGISFSKNLNKIVAGGINKYRTVIAANYY